MLCGEAKLRPTPQCLTWTQLLVHPRLVYEKNQGVKVRFPEADWFSFVHMSIGRQFPHTARHIDVHGLHLQGHIYFPHRGPLIPPQPPTSTFTGGYFGVPLEPK